MNIILYMILFCLNTHVQCKTLRSFSRTRIQPLSHRRVSKLKTLVNTTGTIGGKSAAASKIVTRK